MKINFENLSEQNYHLLIISPDNKKVNSNNHLDNSSEDILNGYLEKKNKEKQETEKVREEQANSIRERKRERERSQRRYISLYYPL